MKQTDELFETLRREAVQAAANSYSPYSRFPVGAAVIDASGRVHVGCNVENASFGLTQCAERVALTAAIAAGAAPGSLQMLVLYTPGARAHSPCGACRQVMHELMAPTSTVASCCDSSEVACWGREEYLPSPFLPDVLLQRE